jgi:acyltransferase
LNKRIEWIDTAKGIGILLVVMGHNTLPKGLEVWIFSFHMPLFFFLSGYVFNPSKYRAFSELLNKKAASLLIPYFFFSFISFLYWLLFRNNIGDSSFNEPLKPLFGIFYSVGADPWMIHNPPLWFLTCLFIVEILFFYILKNVQKPLQILLILFAFSIIGYLESLFIPFRLPWSTDVALTAVVFFGLGYLFKLYNYETKLQAKLTIIIIALVTSISISLITEDKVDMNNVQYGNYALFYIAALCGLTMVIFLSKILSKSKTLDYIGRNSLIIFAFHLPIKPFVVKPLEILNLYQEKSIYISLVVSFIQVFLLIPLCYFINKHFPFILGKRQFHFINSNTSLRG